MEIDFVKAYELIKTIRDIDRKFKELSNEEKNSIDVVFLIRERLKEKYKDEEAYKVFIDILNRFIEEEAYIKGLKDGTSLFRINYDEYVDEGKRPLSLFSLDKETICKIISRKLKISIEISELLYKYEDGITKGTDSYLEGVRNSLIDKGFYFNFYKEGNTVEFIYTEDKEKVIDFIINDIKKSGGDFLDLMNFSDIPNGFTKIMLLNGYIEGDGNIFDDNGNIVSTKALNWKEIFNNDEIEITDLKPYGIRGKINLTVEELLETYGLDENIDYEYEEIIPSLDTVRETAIKGLKDKEMRGPRI